MADIPFSFVQFRLELEIEPASNEQSVAEDLMYYPLMSTESVIRTNSMINRPRLYDSLSKPDAFNFEMSNMLDHQIIYAVYSSSSRDWHSRRHA